MVPKPMVPVAGRPFLERQVEFLTRQGFRRFLLLTGYLGEQIEAHFGDGSGMGVAMRYAREKEPLGTGGGLRRSLPDLEESFLLIYGDSFLPEDYRAIGGKLEAGDAEGVMVVYDDSAGDTSVQPNVALGPSGKVTCYQKSADDGDLRFVEAGVVALRSSALARLPEAGPVALERELYPELARQGLLEASVTEERFFGMGTPAGLERAQRYFRGRDDGPTGHGEARTS
jgi:NDP-sugar pyrophosphorylase family protein